MLQNDHHSRANISTMSHNCCLFFCGENTYSVGNLQVYSAKLWAVITELYFRVPEFIHLLTGSLSSLTNISIYLLYPLITTILLSCEFSFLFHFISFFDCSVQLVGFLVPRPGIEPPPSAVRAQSPNHCTTRELSVQFFYRTFHNLDYPVTSSELDLCKNF